MEKQGRTAVDIVIELLFILSVVPDDQGAAKTIAVLRREMGVVPRGAILRQHTSVDRQC